MICNICKRELFQHNEIEYKKHLFKIHNILPENGDEKSCLYKDYDDDDKYLRNLGMENKDPLYERDFIIKTLDFLRNDPRGRKNYEVGQEIKGMVYKQLNINDDYPENHNVYVADPNKEFKVYKNNKWRRGYTIDDMMEIQNNAQLSFISALQFIADNKNYPDTYLRNYLLYNKK